MIRKYFWAIHFAAHTVTNGDGALVLGENFVTAFMDCHLALRDVSSSLKK